MSNKEQIRKASTVIFIVMMLFLFLIIAVYLGIGAHYWAPSFGG